MVWDVFPERWPTGVLDEVGSGEGSLIQWNVYWSLAGRASSAPTWFDLMVDSGASVLVVDDFRLGRREHLERVMSTGQATVLEADIRSADDLRPVADFEPDTVFHMAALHFIPYCNAHPQEALDVNVLGLESVIRAVRSAPLTSFVFPSSGAIYGFGDERWPENAPPKPDEIYGISKWMGEQIVARFHADRPDVRTVVARLFNTYGPRETNPHVLPAIVAAMHAGQPIELGNLWPQRDLIFVTDTAKAIIATAAGHGFDVFNVGTGTGTTIADVLATIESIRGEALDVREDPERRRHRRWAPDRRPRQADDGDWLAA